MPAWVLGLVLVLCLALTAGAGVNAQEQTIFNKMRGDGGQHRKTLQLHPILCSVARARAQDMANKGYFGHVNKSGEAANYLVRKAGYVITTPGYSTDKKANQIESIAAGRTNADDTYGDWMDSAGHKRHILAQDSFYEAQTNVGVGYVNVPGSEYQHYWVVITAPPPVFPLTISSPAAQAEVLTAATSLSGTAATSLAITLVRFRVENAAGTGAYQPVAGLGSWSAVAGGLEPGANTLRVQALNLLGGVVSEQTRKIYYVLPRPMTVTVEGDGTVTSGFAGTSTRKVGYSYTIGAVAKSGALFAGWTGSLSVPNATATFTMQEGMTLTAHFVPNPFPERKGTYTGLLSGNAGALSLNVTGLGKFSGRLQYDGSSYAVRGSLSAGGLATAVVKRRGQAPLQINLQLDVAGTGGVSGQITDGTAAVTVSSVADYAGKDTSAAGHYTVLLPATGQPDQPPAPGWATLVVKPSGVAVLRGSLANGLTISHTGRLNVNGTVTLFQPLLKNTGALSGSYTVPQTAEGNVSGTLHLSKPFQPKGYYPLPVETDLALMGSHYEKPQAGRPALEVPTAVGNVELQAAEGDLPATVEQRGTLTLANSMTLVGTPELAGFKLAINAKAGTFSGSFQHPVTNKLRTFKGVILQKSQTAAGYFLGVDGSGTVAVSAAQ